MRLLGSRMREIGGQAVIAGAALAAPGIAALKMAADFQTSMTRIQTLVGLTADEVGGMREEVLALAGETARAPRELSEALFVVTSAGARGEVALNILKQAAKAAAIGLGQTADIARTVTAAVTAFADQNLDAERATNILVATVREGNLEAAQLASSLGRVLGPAAALGVSFEDVGAFIATFTRLGGDAAEATTALRATFTSLLKPGNDAQKALEEMGLSAQGLRQQIREEGLTATLVTLNNAFDGNTEGLARVIPNVRALGGILNTVGAQEEEFVRITESMRGELDLVNEGFETTAQTAAFQFRQALTGVQTELISIGTDILPIMVKFLGAVNAVINAFQKLPGPVKAVVVGFGLFAGALFVITGTITLFTGAVLGAAGGLTSLTAAAGKATVAVTGLNLAVLASPLGIALAAAALAVGAAAFIAYKVAVDDAAESTEEFAKSQAIASSAAAREILSELEVRREQLKQIEQSIEASGGLVEVGDVLSDQRAQAIEDITNLEAALQALIDADRTAGDEADEVAGATRGVTDATIEGADAAHDAAQAILNQATAMDELSASALAAKFAVDLIGRTSEEAAVRGVSAFDDFAAAVRAVADELETELAEAGVAQSILDAARGALGLRPRGAERDGGGRVGAGGGGGAISEVARAAATERDRIAREEQEQLLRVLFEGGEARIATTREEQARTTAEWEAFQAEASNVLGVQLPDEFRAFWETLIEEQRAGIAAAIEAEKRLADERRRLLEAAQRATVRVATAGGAGVGTNVGFGKTQLKVGTAEQVAAGTADITPSQAAQLHTAFFADPQGFDISAALAGLAEGINPVTGQQQGDTNITIVTEDRSPSAIAQAVKQAEEELAAAAANEGVAT